MKESTMGSREGVRIFKCDTWEDFIAEVREGVGKLIYGYIYRGHANIEWKLSSIFERWLWRMKGGRPDRNVRELFSPGAFDKIRKLHFERFKEIVISLPGLDNSSLTEEGWWALGRHHGLITPLLDWTKSPYVAAFFAYVEYAEEQNPGFKTGLNALGLKGKGGFYPGAGTVAVWGLAMAPDLEIKGEFEVLRPQVDFPPYSERFRAQQSVFTWLTHDVHVDLESYLVSRGLGYCLERYEIPGQEVRKALSDLALMNISFASLFPDLDGAAAQANIGPSLDVLAMTGRPTEDKTEP